MRAVNGKYNPSLTIALASFTDAKYNQTTLKQGGLVVWCSFPKSNVV
jgi:hypothetical protein